MCCCGQPTVNGQPGYRWQPNDTPNTYPVNPPALNEREQLIFDEPGRCGGLDSHSHHYRVVSSAGALALLVRHGGGDERVRLSGEKVLSRALLSLDSNQRYWVLNAIYHAAADSRRAGAQNTETKWRTAAAEKRIKTRKQRNGGVKVWIESLVTEVAHANS